MAPCSLLLRLLQRDTGLASNCGLTHQLGPVPCPVCRHLSTASTQEGDCGLTHIFTVNAEPLPAPSGVCVCGSAASCGSCCGRAGVAARPLSLSGHTFAQRGQLALTE